MTKRLPPSVRLPFSTGRPGSEQVVEITWHGTAPVYGPSADHPGSTTVEHVRCSHKHPTWEAAEKCGERLGRRTVAERNAEILPELEAAACDIRAAEFDPTDHLWILYCAGHMTSCPHLRPSREAALALGWECPWSEA